MKQSAWIIIAVLAVGALLIWPFGERDNGAPAATGTPQVTVYKAALEDFQDRLEALGTLQGRESVDITANLSEIVTEVHFTEGEKVEKGQLLVTLSQREVHAMLASARADLAEQQREVKRLEGLVRTMSAAQNELDQRRTALDKARYRIEELEARIADRTLRAPFAGVLGLRHVSPGTLISPGTVITTLDDIDSLWLEFSVPSSLLGSLEPGQQLRASTPAYQREFTGVVKVIDSRVNPIDRSVRARALFDNPEGLLKPGMLMLMELHYNPRETVLIPEEALVSRDRRHTVWVVDEESLEASEREVSINGRRPGWVEITDGLEAGELVVRRGLGAMREGVTVKLSNSDEAS